MAAASGWSGDELEARSTGLAALIRRIWRAIARSVAAGSGSQPLTVVETVAARWHTALDEQVLGYVAKTYLDAAGNVAEQTGTVVDQLVGVDLAQRHVAESRNRLRGVGDEVWQVVRQQVTLGLQEGETVQEIAARILGVTGVSHARSLTIARTEVHAAYEAGSYAQALYVDPSGRKRWLATNDGATRKTHRAAADADPVPISQPFIVGGSALRYPGDPLGDPGETINCRCSVAYELGDIISPMADDAPVPGKVAVTAAAAKKWVPSQHPRGHDGKFIKKGAVSDFLSAKTPTVYHLLDAVDELAGPGGEDWSHLTPAQKTHVETALASLPSGSELVQQAQAKLAKLSPPANTLADVANAASLDVAKNVIAKSTQEQWNALTPEQKVQLENTSKKVDEWLTGDQSAQDKIKQLKAGQPASAPVAISAHKGAAPGSPAKITTSLVWAKHEPGTVILEGPSGYDRVVWNGKKYEMQTGGPDAYHTYHEYTKKDLYAELKSADGWLVPGADPAATAAPQLSTDELLQGFDELGTTSSTPNPAEVAEWDQQYAKGLVTTAEYEAHVGKSPPDPPVSAVADSAAEIVGMPPNLGELGAPGDITLKQAHDLIVKTKHPLGTVIAVSASGKQRITRGVSKYLRQSLSPKNVWETIGELSNIDVIKMIRNKNDIWQVPKKLLGAPDDPNTPDDTIPELDAGDSGTQLGQPITAPELFATQLGVYSDGEIVAVGADGDGREYRLQSETSFTGKPALKLLQAQADGSWTDIGYYKSFDEYNLDMGVLGIKWNLAAPQAASSPGAPAHDDPASPAQAPPAPTFTDQDVISNWPGVVPLGKKYEVGEVVALSNDGAYKLVGTGNDSTFDLVGAYTNTILATHSASSVEKGNLEDITPGWHVPLPASKWMPDPVVEVAQSYDAADIPDAVKADFKATMKAEGVGHWSKPEAIWDAVKKIMKKYALPDDPSTSQYVPLQVLKALDSQLKTKDPSPYEKKMVKWAASAKGDAYIAQSSQPQAETSVGVPGESVDWWDIFVQVNDDALVDGQVLATDGNLVVKLQKGDSTETSTLTLHTAAGEEIDSFNFTDPPPHQTLTAMYPGNWVVPAAPSTGLPNHPDADTPGVNVPYTIKNNPKISNAEIFQKLQAAAPGQVLAYGEESYAKTKYRLVAVTNADGQLVVRREAWISYNKAWGGYPIHYTTADDLAAGMKHYIPDGNWVTAENAKIVKPKKTPAPATSALSPAAAPAGQLNIGGGDTSHLAQAKKDNLYAQFKKQPATYLDSPPADIYAALKTIADEQSLSVLQLLRVIDEVGAKKVNAEDKHLFEAKIKDWLKTPQGAAVASGKPIPLPPTPALSPGVSLGGMASFAATSGLTYNVLPASQTTAQWSKWVTAHGTPWTSAQSAALKTYTGGSYFSMNAFLYGKLDSVAASHQKAIKNAQLGMRPSTTAWLLHRGTGFNGVANAKNHDDLVKSVGQTWKSGGFFSTSVGGKAAFSSTPVLVEVEAPPGTPMAWVDPISQYKGENEMLLAAGLHYKIISVKKVGAKSVVRVRVVPPPTQEVTA